jgi:ribonuclease E
MTRKRVGQGLLEAFSTTCEHCNGRGIMVRTDDPDARARPKPVPRPPARNGNQPDEDGAETPAEDEASTPGRSRSSRRRRSARAAGEPGEGPGSVVASPDDPDAAPPREAKAEAEATVVHPREDSDDGATEKKAAPAPARRSRRRAASPAQEVPV